MSYRTWMVSAIVVLILVIGYFLWLDPEEQSIADPSTTTDEPAG